MTTRVLHPRIILLVGAAVLSTSLAHAQATRTWVSGVGDDVNPCSRTAPCKTFPGAISKTAINGEIDVLDPGGFGAITITKSITLDGTLGAGFGSILASGVNGVVINIAAGNANDPLRTVRLRNLSINGTGTSGTVGTRTGLNGIRIIAADVVFIENVVVSDFSQRGISDERTTGGRLFIKDTVVRNNAGSGIVIFPASGTTTINAFLDNVRSERNGSTGIVASMNSRMTARNSVASGNVIGFASEQAGTEVNLENCVATNNGTGLQNGSGAPSILRISNCAVFNNTTNGIQILGGQVLTYGNNKIGGNAGNQGGLTPANPPIQ
jgi:hypothetical protein